MRDRPPRHDVGLSSWSRTSGAAAKVEKKVEKKPNHEAWKARMCGLEKLKMGMAVALCSASTGTEKRRPKISIVPLLLTPLRSKHSCSEAISALADCACACRSSTSSLSSVTSFAADIATRFHTERPSLEICKVRSARHFDEFGAPRSVISPREHKVSAHYRGPGVAPTPAAALLAFGRPRALTRPVRHMRLRNEVVDLDDAFFRGKTNIQWICRQG